MENDEVHGVFRKQMYLRTNVHQIMASLRKLKSVKKKKGDRVIIIGGDNAAMDAAHMRTFSREFITVAYRRSQEQMPALLSDTKKPALKAPIQWSALQ